VLVRHRVDFVLVGGLAGIAHNSSYATQDIDIVYARDGENLERLAAALAEVGATLRGAPPGPPSRPMPRRSAPDSTAGRPMDLLMASEYRTIADELRAKADGEQQP
jgi:hypothetical protein